MSDPRRSPVPTMTRWRATVRSGLRSVKRASARLGFVELFDNPTVKRIRLVFFKTRRSDVVEVGEALSTAGIDFAVAGGWGVDLLVGEQTRSHNDIDVVVDGSGDREARAVAALGGIGYAVAVERSESGPRFPVRSVLRDRQGRTIDLIVATTEPGARSSRGEELPLLPSRWSVEGTIDGRTIPCLPVDLQIDAHRGYVPHARDRHDMEQLRRHFDVELPRLYQARPSQPSLIARSREALVRLARFVGLTERESAVLVLVDEARAAVTAVTGNRPDQPPPHITVVHPFVPAGRISIADEERLAALAREFERTSVRLTSIASFPGVTYLTPEPAGLFVALTEQTVRLWPDHPPYAGAHDEVIPHLTIAYGVEPDDIAGTIEPWLPIASDFRELTLMIQDRRGRWKERRRFPLADPGAHEH